MRGKINRISITSIVFHLVLSIFSLFCIIPIIYIVSISLTDENSLSLYGYKLVPKLVSTYAYQFVFASPKQVLTSYGVTILVTAIGSILSLLVTSMLAYTMSRRDFKLSKLISFVVFFTMIFNTGLVPWYILIVRYYHINNTLLCLILPYVIVPWNVFLMKGFLADIPLALVESAKIDGSSELNTFFKIIIPISKPALATVGLFCAFMYWNDWWLGMLFIEKQSLTPLQLMLYSIMNNITYLSSSLQSGNISIDVSKMPNETARMAMCVLAAGPMLFVFPFFQKFFIRGLTVGAVKG
ncbi:carbohydrate ABC transporter permease [Ruminiclostridium cellobioparum]|uniref:ABC-type sugar transport system, permease component n=2 Tax=Ruminiclostridium cellobioparum TaxID=29355 RepID=S0FKE8_RUMCE|nr:carbohydrate ABC transporter permease [Ruminiclostridium cellobioparum]EMS68993.1 ABC-type sugar transport system, permease component [Ruminiclostridium cellobioparum subsp. termitidis CT1112]